MQNAPMSLTSFTGQQSATMSSRVIAELVESRHDSVKRTIERCVEKAAIVQPPTVDEQSSDALGRTRVTQALEAA